MRQALEILPSIRRRIVIAIKREGPLAIEQLARRMGVTYEAVRQQVVHLEREGWIAEVASPGRAGLPGRPRRAFGLTAEGDQLFAKSYADLAVELIDAVAGELEPAALKKVLGSLIDARLRHWRPLLEGKSLRERLEVLRGIYQADDPFTLVESTADGGLRLVERNCPYLDVAQKRPALCSVTVSTLSRLLGCRVVREEKFQNGDGCCAFRVLTDEPVDDAEGVELEPDSA